MQKRSYFDELEDHFQHPQAKHYWRLLVSLLFDDSLTISHLRITSTWDKLKQDETEAIINEVKQLIQNYAPNDDQLRLLLLKYGHLRALPSNAQKLSEITTCLGQARLVTGERARTRMLAVLLNSRGVCNQHLNNIAAGLQDYDEALKLHSDYAMVLYNRGNWYLAQQMLLQAVDDYTSTVRVDPDYEAAYYNRSICYSSIGKMVHATRDAIVATNLLPENYPKSQSLKRFLHREAKDPLFQ